MKIFLAGDSTMQYNDYKTYPQTGWGQVFPLFINESIEVTNYAKNGTSTKSFILEGRLKRIKDEIQKGDFLFIQFGHNDQKSDERGTKPYFDYQKNLQQFINVARSVDAIPILLTPIYRRHFDNEGKIKDFVHLDYPLAMISLAKKENVLCLDLCEKTKEIFASLGDTETRKFFMRFSDGEYLTHPMSSSDDTHLRYDGAYLISYFVYEMLKEIGQPYSDILK